MTQLRFDAITGELLPQKVRYEIKHNELDEELIDKYVNNECNFQIEYKKEGEPKIIKKNKKRGKKI